MSLVFNAGRDGGAVCQYHKENTPWDNKKNQGDAVPSSPTWWVFAWCQFSGAAAARRCLLLAA